MGRDYFQIILIVLGFIATSLFAVFVWREAFPEYKIYQKNYVALEKFRSTYTGEAPPDFSIGIKQIVILKEDKGPAKIDRCISCHVALEYSHFSATKIARDLNGNIIYNEDGIPKQITNEDDVWARLDLEILKLEKSNQNSEAEKLRSLKTAHVNGNIFDVKKVLKMHPLMGAETRPFEFHPIEEYGCTSCHNGNGLGLTTIKAHGPVFDGQYEVEFEGPVPQFNEKDELNDPKFAKNYNGKPGHDVLFQTSPIFVGALIQAKCMQCHQVTAKAIETAGSKIEFLTQNDDNRIDALQKAFNKDQETLLSTLELKSSVSKIGVLETVNQLKTKLKDYSLTDKERQLMRANLDFLTMSVGGSDGLRHENAQAASDLVLMKLNASLEDLLGKKELVDKLEKDSNLSGKDIGEFLIKYQNESAASGFIFKKLKKLNTLTKTSEKTFKFDNSNFKNSSSVVDSLVQNFQRGEQLYVVQACYACHRIAGVSRGGVGPELTEIGKGYPWAIKDKLVFPQRTLQNSAMPNYHLDHPELQDLMTYLLAQTGSGQAVGEIAHKLLLKDWEEGKKTALEKPLSSAVVHDLKNSMTIFATEGCAACHRLKGFESDVGFTIEKEKYTFDSLFKTRQWFQELVPESIIGSRLIQVIEKNLTEFDERISNDVRTGSILEEIEKNFPETIETFYPSFAFAARHKNHEIEEKISNEKDKSKIESHLKDLKEWKDRVRSILMIYIQEYGLGRIIGPKINWSGVSRSDEWLMQHFRNPAGLVPNSIMPIFPFDDSKFYALTSMLDALSKVNRDRVREIWNHDGFSPRKAYDIFCSSCHGDQLNGNGVVAEWIYPVPKNLRNSEFLRNLTKENAINSIKHGIKGTPMAPWGEFKGETTNGTTGDNTPALTQNEIEKIVDWIFTAVSGDRINQQTNQVSKWDYDLKAVHDELKGVKIESLNEDSSDSLFNRKQMINQPVTTPTLEYFIDKKYFTEENILQGKRFFELNCASCHGKEADGAGARGSVMLDARPRNLTNAEWLGTKDDLQILRSIKYGVPGTSMGAWGDLTSPLQRIQLAIFIRSLNIEALLRQKLNSVIYDALDSNIFFLEKLRGKDPSQMIKLENQINALEQPEKDDEKSVANFKEKLALKQKLALLKTEDNKLTTLQDLMKEEKKIYMQMGLDFLAKQLPTEVFDTYLKLVALNRNRFRVENEKLIMNDISNIKESILKLRDQIATELDKKAAILKNSEAENAALEIKGYEKLKNSLFSGLKTIFELINTERQVINQ